MKTFSAALLTAMVFSLLGVWGVDACIVGDLNAPPAVRILEAPPDCCYGEWAGDITGMATNIDTDSVAVVLYAQTNVYWVQPLTATQWTTINCDGTFSNRTHGGHHYCAILARKTWDPPPTMGYLPPVGGDILATDCAPSIRPPIEFGDCLWQVKQAGQIKVDPGPNYFSDRPENVWVDDAGQLHLKITHVNGNWYCAEVFTDQYLAHGLYRFEVEGPVDQLDPNVIFAGFVYSDQGDEIDIEFSRWGNASTDLNAQYVVQPYDIPGNRYRFPFVLTGIRSTHEIHWEPNRIQFASFQGVSDLAEVWVYEGLDNPTPDVERMRFNLWLLNGNAPTNQQEIEVVVSRFDYLVAVEGNTWGSLKKMLR